VLLDRHLVNASRALVGLDPQIRLPDHPGSFTGAARGSTRQSVQQGAAITHTHQ
jgi:hypothetical protein